MFEIGDNYPAGQYVCLYEGEGDIHFEWDAQILSQEPGRIVLNVVPEFGIHMVISSTNPKNYIRNIRVIMLGFESIYEQQPFHPSYVTFLRNFSTLRFMDWAQTVEGPPGVWAERTTPASATQASLNGVALEYMIQLANEVGANAWFNNPHTATDTYVQNMAQLIRDQLNPAFQVHIEYSNEVWNPDFIANGYARQQGLQLGLSPEPFVAALYFHSRRSVEIFNIFEQVFGSTDRLVRTMGGWIDNELETSQWILSEILDYQNAYQSVDAYSIAPYFGYRLGTPELADQLATMSFDDILDWAAEDMNLMLGIAASLKASTDARGIDLVTYEGGQDLRGIGPQMDDPSVVERFTAANRHPRMYDLYTEYLNSWHWFGDFMTLYSDIRTATAWGSWGLLERWNQPVSEAHKFHAVLDFLNSGAPIATQSPQPVSDSGTSQQTRPRQWTTRTYTSP